MRARTRLIIAAAATLGLLLGTVPATGAAAATTFREDFTRLAHTGSVDTGYPQSWQPYPNGMSGKYYSDEIVSVHGGVLDVSLDGKRGAAGTFGTKAGAWGHKGGTFTVRAKATGADGNGIAFLLWPTSDVWSDGEIDFPEGGVGGGAGEPHVFHHSTVKGHEREQVAFESGVRWDGWHTYTIVWKPGKSVDYRVDGHSIGTVTKWVPTTAHRFMVQTGNTGKPGHLLIDYVQTTS